MKHVSLLSADSAGNEAAMFAQRRAAIDLIATTRARAIRAALFGAYLYRTNPKHPEDEETRAQWRNIIKEQADHLNRIKQLVTGRDPLGVLPAELCEWIGAYGASRQKHMRAFADMSDLTERLLKAVNSGDEDDLEQALSQHLVFGRGGFFDTVTEFCDGMWANLDLKRHNEVEHAAATGAAITKTLTRLEHIGKHVRLVSLNASVEAARVGDAGRGLGVIAVEFKTLAEEIQILATTARADIAAMTQHGARIDTDPAAPAA